MEASMNDLSTAFIHMEFTKKYFFNLLEVAHFTVAKLGPVYLLQVVEFHSKVLTSIEKYNCSYRNFQVPFVMPILLLSPVFLLIIYRKNLYIS